ncbi:MAG: CBS domain-containing protein [Thermoprotei archaeon]|jgi:CBS domain-containing protein
MSYAIKVKELMTPKNKLITVKPSITILEAIKIMNEKGVGSVLVVENDKLVGIFTERDVVRTVANEINLNERLEKVMTKKPVIVEEEDYLSKASLLMSEKNVRHLPVINKEGKLVGIISARDLATYFYTIIEREV